MVTSWKRRKKCCWTYGSMCDNLSKLETFRFAVYRSTIDQKARSLLMPATWVIYFLLTNWKKYCKCWITWWNRLNSEPQPQRCRCSIAVWLQKCDGLRCQVVTFALCRHLLTDGRKAKYLCRQVLPTGYSNAEAIWETYSRYTRWSSWSICNPLQSLALNSK